eukprot:COSAG04_NODE_1409_length_6882_cov_4.508625_2_plen_211_part_00
MPGHPRPSSPPSPPTTPSSVAPAVGPAPASACSASTAADSAPAELAVAAWPRTYEATRTNVLALQAACFRGCHPGFEPPSSGALLAKKSGKEKRRTLLRPWILPAPTSAEAPEAPAEATVRVWDSSLDGSAYTTFAVLGWQDKGVVLGAELNGSTHLRVIPRIRLPASTRRGLDQIERRNAPALEQAYDDPTSFIETVASPSRTPWRAGR